MSSAGSTSPEAIGHVANDPALAEPTLVEPANGPAPDRLQRSPAVMPTDGELLMQYARHGDAAALATVVDRHKAMVWSVCTRILPHRQEAEDAYQAAFLILVQKSGSIRASDSVAGWLFRVAYRSALTTRRRRQSRREEALASEPLAPEQAFPAIHHRQTVAVLLEELRGLPERYQTPLVMRYLEGESRRKIADATDATIATVAGLLVRGKRMLRQRLARRGVSLAVAAGVFVGSNAVAAEGVSSTATTTISPPPPFDPTAAASTAVAHLVTQGVRSMLFASLAKPVAIAAVGVTAAALLLVGPSTDAGASGGAQQLVLDSGAQETPPTDTPAVRIAQQPPAAAEQSGAEVVIETTKSPAPAVATILVPMDLEKQREEAEMVARARAHWAKKARAESGIDLSQPSFAELFKMRTYWSAMENAAESELERLQRSMKSQPNNVTAKQVTEAFAQIQQAKAKQLELERQMKLAALREEAADRPTESNPESDPAAFSKPSNRSGGFGGRGGFRNRPATSLEAASPAQPPSAAIPARRQNDEVFRDAANSLAFTLLNEAIKRPRDEFPSSNDPLPRAKALFARFLDEGQSYRALVGMAQCLEVEGDHDAALEYWQRAYGIKPHNRIDEGLSLLEWIAHNYARPGLWSLAEPWLQRVLKEKGNPHIEPYAGWLLKANSEWQKARRNAAANYT
ncbi:MAG: sigma-70 family RNA polymerase sigma factor, partial [Planctomycetota bacterium]